MRIIKSYETRKTRRCAFSPPFVILVLNQPEHTLRASKRQSTSGQSDPYQSSVPKTKDDSIPEIKAHGQIIQNLNHFLNPEPRGAEARCSAVVRSAGKQASAIKKSGVLLGRCRSYGDGATTATTTKNILLTNRLMNHTIICKLPPCQPDRDIPAARRCQRPLLLPPAAA